MSRRSTRRGPAGQPPMRRSVARVSMSVPPATVVENVSAPVGSRRIVTSRRRDRHTRPLRDDTCPRVAHGGDQVAQMLSRVPVVVVPLGHEIAGGPFS